MNWRTMKLIVGQSVQYPVGNIYTIVQIDDNFYPRQILIELDDHRSWISEDKLSLVSSSSG